MNGHFIHGKIKLKRCMSFINKKNGFCAIWGWFCVIFGSLGVRVSFFLKFGVKVWICECFYLSLSLSLSLHHHIGCWWQRFPWWCMNKQRWCVETTATCVFHILFLVLDGRSINLFLFLFCTTCWSVLIWFSAWFT